MTRKQKNSLLRKARFFAVTAAAIYMISGIAYIGKDNAKAEEKLQNSEIVEEVQHTVETEDSQLLECQTVTYSCKELSPYECYLLCKLAMAEAGNQDTEGKALVILVVLNRVRGDNEFPDTVEDVIYQKNQFSPVLEGKYETTIPSEDCWKALDMVLDGWDGSRGALFFESKSSSTWHEDNLEFLFKHGGHYFYR